MLKTKSHARENHTSVSTDCYHAWSISDQAADIANLTAIFAVIKLYLHTICIALSRLEGEGLADLVMWVRSGTQRVDT